jgi:hypothetical protein
MKYILIIILLSAPFLLNAELLTQHYPPSVLNRTGETGIILTLLGPRDNLEEVILSYREIGQYTYREIERKREDITSQEVTFLLPRLAPPAAGYEYFFIIRSSETQTTLPVNQPQLNPFRVSIPLTDTAADLFILLNPVTEIESDQDLVFAVSLYNLEKIIDPASVSLFLNGKDITGSAIYTPPLLVYTLSSPRAGIHNFQVRAQTKDGQPLQSPVWRYSVAAKATFLDELPIDIGGQAIFNSNLRNELESNDEEETMRARTRNDASLRLNLHGRKDWFAFRTRLYLSSYESSSKQAVNRFTLGFTVPHFEMDIFDSTPDYGSFLLSNNNVRGASLKAHYGVLTLQSAYGETSRALEGKTLTDSTFTAGTFQRHTFAGRLEIGTHDFLSFGLGFAKNKDRTASLAEQYYRFPAADEDESPGSLLVTPKDNVVLGSNVRLALDNQRFVLGAEIATSLYNSNTLDGVISKEELEEYLEESVPFDPESFESIIIINKNVEPIIPNMASVAYRLYVNWFIAGNFLNLSYSEVGASFRSLSSGYLQNDARILTVSDNVSLLNNQLLLDAGLNLIRDNLSEQKNTTTTNTNWYLQTMVRPRDLPYLRLGYNQNSYSDDLKENEIDQQMGAFNIGAGYNFVQIPFATTTLDIGMTLADDKDNTEMKAFDQKRTGFQINLYNAMREIPLTSRIGISSTSQKDIGDISNSYFSFSFRNEYAFLQETVRPYLNLRFNTLGGDQDDQQISNYELGTIYQPFLRTTVNTSFEIMSYQNKEIDDLDYSVFTWRLNIAQRF